MTPFKFSYFLKTPLWGGRDIVDLKGIDGYETIGESWEISALPGNESQVVDGPHKGKTLRELIDTFGAEFIGTKNLQRFGNRFPLLVKFLSTAADLSIQVHPNDQMAKEAEQQPNGKTEAWYVIKATNKAALYCGFKKDIHPQDYDTLLAACRLPEALARYETRRGDCFFIPAGQIHCIGADNFIIEIQQSSDTTYRVYDFDRRDREGKLRQLHTEKARQALNFTACPTHHAHYAPPLNRRILLERHPEFVSALYHVNRNLHVDFSKIDSFVILIAFEGKAQIIDHEGNKVSLCGGETILFPASTSYIDIQPKSSGLFSFIETYVE